MTPFGRVDLMIDTNIASYVLNGDPIAERYRPDLEDKVLGISFQAMAELLVGWRRQGWDNRKFRNYVGGLIEIPYSAEIRELFVQVRVESLDRQESDRGRKVQAADAWVAATALSIDRPLVTHNPRDFDEIAGLTVIPHPDPARPA